jgi:hypothetical protein
MRREGLKAEDSAAEIQRLVRLFLPNCNDSSTLLILDAMGDDRTLWPSAHLLFQRIRAKTLTCGPENTVAYAQYLFEEVCAKTFYNLSGCPAPFDKDAPDWIWPNALNLARSLGLPDSQVAQGRKA